ncbi:MAG: outer membrane protein assembly factor BamA [Deltaproteobacteria bacterium]|nr:outer membrane protein assembly factor BamA [Deltaproteobacteria bacterium]
MWLLICMGLVLSAVPAAGSEDPVKVTLFPFRVNAQTQYAYLEKEITVVIQDRLRKEGIRVMVPGKAVTGADTAAMTRAARDLAVQNESTHAVWGSLTQVGQRFSIDARVMDVSADTFPASLTVGGERIETLLGAVKKLADELMLRILKQEKVVSVTVSGNKRIEKDAVLRIVQVKPGDPYRLKALSEDLNRIYRMGYFEDVRVDAEDVAGGKALIFRIREKPTIRKIRFKGNRVYDEKELLENIDIRSGSILNIFKVKSNLKRIEDLYKKKNYHNAEVSYEIEALKNNQADLEFVISEGKKLRIQTITFEGNTVFDAKTLKKVMSTSEKGLFSFITSSGDLDRDKLAQDKEALAAYYQNHGYLNARVSDPEVKYEEDGIEVIFKISEGPRYTVGTVTLSGDVEDKAALKEKLAITKKTYFSRKTVRKDVLALTDLYSDQGYANVEIFPKINENPETRVVAIDYRIRKGPLVSFEKILISGNRKTRDYVIRRELKVYEQERFSSTRLKRSVRNLYRLDYFEDVKVQTQKGTTENQMVLKIDVTEKSTGSFSIGAGYSSEDDFFAMASVTQRNLFGRGQIVSLQANVGGRSDRYNLSFTEPWLFNIPLSGRVDLYRWIKDYDTYDKDATGGGLRLGYPLWTDYLRFTVGYAYEISNIEDIQEDAPPSIKDFEGTNTQSTVSADLRWDSRNRIFNPTEGSEHRFTVEYAGFGGNIAFTKYIGKTGWYFPIFKGTVGFLHAKAGYVEENPGGRLPDWERFYLGGISSLRGFKYRSVSPKNEDGIKIGGNKFIQFNAEYLVPLFPDMGIFGVAFFDTGNAYNNDEDIELSNMRESAGLGFRWFSPVGPIRLEYGLILDRQEDESAGRWEFSMSTGF